MKISMTINGKSYSADVEPQLRLVDFLRDNLGLTGTKVGCDTGQCSSCVVLLNNVSVKSCKTPVSQADGANITTVEGTDSVVKMIIDTPAKRMYEGRVKLLIAGEADRLVEEHYHDDAVLVSFEFVVRGRESLRAHFRNFVKSVKIKEVLSTDRFVETEDSFFYEATAVTNYGVGRVYDAYYLRNGKIAYHFTGTIT